MDSFFKFAGEHPILVVILTMIVVGGVVKVIRGYNPHGDD